MVLPEIFKTEKRYTTTHNPYYPGNILIQSIRNKGKIIQFSFIENSDVELFLLARKIILYDIYNESFELYIESFEYEYSDKTRLLSGTLTCYEKLDKIDFISDYTTKQHIFDKGFEYLEKYTYIKGFIKEFEL